MNICSRCCTLFLCTPSLNGRLIKSAMQPYRTGFPQSRVLLADYRMCVVNDDRRLQLSCDTI